MRTRVQIGCPEYPLDYEYIEVGWDTVLTKKRDDSSVGFTFEPKSDVTIKCSSLPLSWAVDVPEKPWETLVLMDNGCWIFQVVVEGFCNGSWDIIWFGQFTSTEWRINLDRKYVVVRPKQFTNLTCLKQNWETEYNVFDVPPGITVRPYNKGYETTEYFDFYGVPCITVTPPDVPDYCFDEVTENSGTPLDHPCTFHYHRIVREGTCVLGVAEPPDLIETWNLFEDNCPDPPLYWGCPDSNRIVFVFERGKFLNNILEYLVSQIDCGLSLVSDFLGINPDDTHPDNSAYDYAAANLNQLILFQKSDVKRFDSSNGSTEPAWGIKLKPLMEDLCLMFNLKIKEYADLGVLRIEHISYFDATAGNDYTNEGYIKELQRDNSDTPRLTRFEYRDKQCSDYFRGFPIEIFCGEGEKDFRLTLFSTDVSFITNADNAESIGDDGWVLMTTELIDGIYRVIQDNRPLSWTELHEALYVYDMVGPGKINDETVTPESLRKTRKQPPFSVKHCCDQTFNPENYIITSMGQANVDNADWNLTHDSLTLTVKY